MDFEKHPDMKDPPPPPGPEGPESEDGEEFPEMFDSREQYEKYAETEADRRQAMLDKMADMTPAQSKNFRLVEKTKYNDATEAAIQHNPKLDTEEKKQRFRERRQYITTDGANYVRSIMDRRKNEEMLAERKASKKPPPRHVPKPRSKT